MVQFIARRPLNLGDHWAQPGDLVPEAMDWPNLSAYLEFGWVEKQEESAASAASGSPTRPRAVPPSRSRTRSSR